MTRQHYEAIAKAIKAVVDNNKDDYKINTVLIDIVNNLNDNIRIFNDNFNSNRFKKACGI